MSQSTPQKIDAPDAPTAPKINACWQEIGVYGNRSCPELPAVVHCRNCIVYSRAGLAVLDQPITEDYRRECTEHFARPQTAKPQARRSAIVFRIGEELFALPTHTFQEVAECRVIHSIPHRRDGMVLGLANVRGELLICVELGHLLGSIRLTSPQLANEILDPLLVVSWDSHRFCFPASKVLGVERFQLEDVKPAPATVARAEHCFTNGLLYCRGTPVGLLDAPRLFTWLNGRLS